MYYSSLVSLRCSSCESYVRLQVTTKSPKNRLDRPTRDSQVISRNLSLRHDCRELHRPSTSLLDHASRQRSAKLQAQIPKAFTGALLAELRPSPVIPVTFVAPTANSARYGCRLPSASATVIVINDGRYQYRCCRSRFFTGVNEPFTIAISGLLGGSYPLLLRAAFCR